ncbi:hypothetical protein YC2023_079067 [Brassica napus]
MASISENVVPSQDSIKRNLDALDFPGMKDMVDFDSSEELRSSLPAAWLQGRNSELPALEEMFQNLRNHILQVVNPQAPLEESLRKPAALEQASVRVVQMINDPELEPILAELGGHVPTAHGFQTDQAMASCSERTLPCPDSSKITSPALKFDALDFPAMKAMEDFETCARELGEKMREDPAYILELSRCNPAAKFDQEQLSNMGQMFQRLEDHARQVLVHYYKLDDDDDDPDDNFDPRASFENLGKPGALEEFAERVAQIRKDPEVEPILAELDACPAALLKFVDDKQVLKKLGKSMLRSQGLNYDDDDEELVSEGRKALKIAFGYAKMKCFKVLLDAERKKANKVERKKKTTSHHASTSGKTKRSSRLSNKCDAV